MQKSKALFTIIIGMIALTGSNCLNNKQPKITFVLYNMETVLEGRAETEKGLNRIFCKCKDKDRERTFVVTDNGLAEFDNLGREINLEKRDYIDAKNELDFYAVIHLVPKNQVPAEEDKQMPYRLFDRKNHKWPTFQPFDHTKAATITVKKEKGKWYFWSGNLDVYRPPKSSCTAIINETPVEDDLYSLREIEQQRFQAELAKQMETQRKLEEQEQRRRETEVLEDERKLYKSAQRNAKDLVQDMPRCGNEFYALGGDDENSPQSSQCFYKLLDVQALDVNLQKAGYVKNDDKDKDNGYGESEEKKPIPRFKGRVRIVALKAERYCYDSAASATKLATQDTSYVASNFTKTITIECNGDECSITRGEFELPCGEISRALGRPARRSERQGSGQKSEVFDYLLDNLLRSDRSRSSRRKP